MRRHEEREHVKHSARSEFGKSSVVIDCPFCGESVRAYVWSLAGSGKRCPGCGAIHGGWWKTWRTVEVTE